MHICNIIKMHEVKQVWSNAQISKMYFLLAYCPYKPLYERTYPGDMGYHIPTPVVSRSHTSSRSLCANLGGQSPVLSAPGEVDRAKKFWYDSGNVYKNFINIFL